MAVSNASSSAASTADRELIFTRVFDAPRRLVFRAWTDPGCLQRWWGPKGFTHPVCQVDARVTRRTAEAAPYLAVAGEVTR